jgi:hypothetical protein
VSSRGRPPKIRLVSGSNSLIEMVTQLHDEGIHSSPSTSQGT